MFAGWIAQVVQVGNTLEIFNVLTISGLNLKCVIGTLIAINQPFSGGRKTGDSGPNQLASLSNVSVFLRKIPSAGWLFVTCFQW